MLEPGSIVAEAYGAQPVEERHRHRYEVNNAYRDKLEEAGLVFSGTSPDGELVEFVELPRDVHPYYVATQAHPELRSRPTRPHPLFAGLIGAALDRQRELRFPIDESGLRREPVDVGRSTGPDHRRTGRRAPERGGRRPAAARPDHGQHAVGVGQVLGPVSQAWSQVVGIISRTLPAMASSPRGEGGGLVEEPMRPRDHQLVLDRPPEAAREVLHRRAGRARAVAPEQLPGLVLGLRAGRAAERQRPQARVGVGVALRAAPRPCPRRIDRARPAGRDPPRQVDVGRGLVEQGEVLGGGRAAGERAQRRGRVLGVVGQARRHLGEPGSGRRSRRWAPPLGDLRAT